VRVVTVGLTETLWELVRRSNVTLMGGPLAQAFCRGVRHDAIVLGSKVESAVLSVSFVGANTFERGSG
jgi:hypothetical protein